MLYAYLASDKRSLSPAHPPWMSKAYKKKKNTVSTTELATHPLVLLNGTTVYEKHAALVASQRALVQQCKAAGIPDRAPTQELCKKQLMLCLPDKTYAIFKTIVAESS